MATARLPARSLPSFSPSPLPSLPGLAPGRPAAPPDRQAPAGKPRLVPSLRIPRAALAAELPARLATPRAAGPAPPPRRSRVRITLPPGSRRGAILYPAAAARPGLPVDKGTNAAGRCLSPRARDRRRGEPGRNRRERLRSGFVGRRGPLSGG